MVGSDSSITHLLLSPSVDAWILQKGKPGYEFYLREDEYVEYLRLNHGYKGLVGQQGGDEGVLNSTIVEVDEEAGALIRTGVAGHAADGGTTQSGETVKEQDMLANAVKDISVLLKVLIAIALCGLVVMISNLVVFLFK